MAYKDVPITMGFKLTHPIAPEDRERMIAKCEEASRFVGAFEAYFASKVSEEARKGKK